MPEPKPIVVLNDKIRQELNRILQDAQTLLGEVTKQHNAGVPGMDAVADRCSSCIDRITQFKEVNFPGKK